MEPSKKEKFIFTNGHETIEHETLMLDPEVSARLVKAGPLTIRQRFADGTERLILDGGTAPVATSTTPTDAPAPVVTPPVVATPADVTQSVSTWTNTVHDADAAKRIEAMRAHLAANGVKVDASEQYYATGTRMAREGYATQRARAKEHAALTPFAQAAEELASEVRAEKREDVIVTAAEIARTLVCNGKISTCGVRLNAHAVKGILGSIDSPASRYVTGLNERIAAEVAVQFARPESERDLSAVKADRARIAETLAYELTRPSVRDTKIKLRTRAAIGDCYAAVTPGYAPADAPEVTAQILSHVPAGARGSWAYDPDSTVWELRASVWTPTPVDAQAVGEPFEAYTTFQSADNRTSSFRGGGGVMLLRCLNASTYTAAASEQRRRHVGKILYDIEAMLRGSVAALHTLCNAWGTNRAAVVEIPKAITNDGPIPLSVAIPGFWRFMLTDRRSDLVGILKGKTEEHVKGLSAAYDSERRDSERIVRADFAQGWTRYVQAQSTPVRREAEAAIGDWLVRGRPIACVLPDTK